MLSSAEAEDIKAFYLKWRSLLEITSYSKFKVLIRLLTIIRIENDDDDKHTYANE